MRTIRLRTVVVGLTISIASLVLLISLLKPRGPRDDQEAIQVACRYAKETKPSYPFDQYEVVASWDGATRCWVISFIANRPYIHTTIEINYDTGICRNIPVHYSPVVSPHP
jgi:hypothetical protein